MKEQLEQELVKVGLSEKEAKVYLTALELGPSTAQSIAAKATVNRPTTYVMIESLIKRGLMSSFEKGKKRFFVAAAPRQLLYVINQQKYEITEKERIVENLIATIETMSTNRIKLPAVQMFEGIDGIRAVQEDILATKATELLEVVSVDESKKFLPPIFSGDIREKILSKYKIKSLYCHAPGPTIVDHKNVDSRYLQDNQKFPIQGDVIIYGEKVSMISYRNNGPINIIINDSNIATTLRTMFFALWVQAIK